MQSGSRIGNSDDTPLAALAARQHGVVSIGQLRALGYSKHAVHDRAVAGRLHRVHRGVYAVGHRTLSIRGQWFAAVLACGPGAALSHRDAAALHNLRTTPTGDMDVTAPSRHRLPGICCHYTRHLDPPDLTVVEGLSVTTVERTALDLASDLHPQRLADLLERIERHGAFDLTRFTAIIDRSPGHRGCVRLRAALTELTDEPPWTQSELELSFRHLIEREGLPTPQFNVYVEGELCDVVWAEHRLVVEIDGWEHHGSRRPFEDNRRRDGKLVTAGWRVLRITYRRLRDEPAAVVAQIRTLLRAVPWPLPAR
ncbi:MAG: type IV toxin-antitoxin system AbiEi family antitoxin domain-containing protein [Solirubrobacteraceae bacterium]